MFQCRQGLEIYSIYVFSKKKVYDKHQAQMAKILTIRISQVLRHYYMNFGSISGKVEKIEAQAK